MKISVALLCALLAACGGGGSMTPAATPTPAGQIYSCIFAGVPVLTLVSPTPGATNVPDTNVTIVLDGTLDTQYGAPAIALSTTSGPAASTSEFTAIGSGSYSVTFAQLQHATTYTVGYAVQTGESYPCNVATLSLGSFTTQ